MEVGLLMVFQNFMDQTTDRKAYERDIHLAALAEPLGFDTVSSVEHHFFNYAMAPDNPQFLSYLAAKTSKIKLLTERSSACGREDDPAGSPEPGPGAVRHRARSGAARI
jgi:alkanesulfonate monooxygenase SsuD/methylene tetrahydromethanopterin reductase-like flavin-dependent oxidoreductase (luciferase family)